MSDIENVIALDPNFVRLDQTLRRFNIFDALGVRNHEIRHSNFLGYLLDPNQSHDLGAEFLSEFLRNVSRKSGQAIPLLDLNLSLAQVEREKRFQSATDSSLDLFVTIPKMDGTGRFVLAIENKINAKQSKGQLDKYSKHLEKECPESEEWFIKIYLTLNGEDANSDGWHSLAYSDVVTPTIEAVQEGRSDTAGDYLIQILKDYLAAIAFDNETSSDLDNIVTSLMKDENGIIQAIKRDKNGSNLQRVRVLFPRAYSYIKDFDSDPRTEVLKRYKEIDFYKKANLEYETSSRRFLRSSFLTEENGKKIASICAHSTKPWVDSKRHLILELELLKREDDDAQKKIDGEVWLMLGPTNSNYPHRNELVQELKGSNELKSASPDFTKIKLKHQYAKSFNGKDSSEVIKWIDTNYLKIAEAIQEEINTRLTKFFEKYPLPS